MVWPEDGATYTGHQDRGVCPSEEQRQSSHGGEETALVTSSSRGHLGQPRCFTREERCPGSGRQVLRPQGQEPVLEDTASEAQTSRPGGPVGSPWQATLALS